MLETRGRHWLWTALALIGAGLALPLAGLVLAGAVLLGGLVLEILRLRKGLQPLSPPWGLTARLKVDKDSDGHDLAAHRVGREVTLRLDLRIPKAFDGARLQLLSWSHSPGVEVQDGLGTLVVRNGEASLQLRSLPQSAAVHRILGVQARLQDALGLLSAQVFVPCPCELAVLPRSLPLDLKRVAETRRNAPRSGGGQRPDKVPGHGDELRELREHLPGDAYKHIAWKASAIRGRLMARSFQREQTRALYVVLDTGATMRDGRPGLGPLDQALDLVHSLAEAAARAHDPFACALVDGRVVDRRPVHEGLASLRDTDRALLDIRRVVAEDLAPLDDSELFSIVSQYLTAIDRVPLPVPDQAAPAQRIWRQRVVMAALARLPDRERLPLLRGAEPSARTDTSILRRFCRAMDLPLPYRTAHPPAVRVQGLVEGLNAAVTARKGPFAIVIVSDFRRLSGACQPLWQAAARARQLGNRVLAVAVREVEAGDLLDLGGPTDDLDTVRGLVRADQAARQQLLDELTDGARRVGAAFLADPNPQELVALWRA